MLAEPGVPYTPGPRAEALGQVRNSYNVARTFEGLVIVDQHAAHEAALTEQLLAERRPQPLLRPVRLELTAQEAELLALHVGVLSDLGLEIEAFGRNTVLVRALPAPLVEQDAASLLTELVEELAAHRGLGSDALLERLAARAACRAAIKAGDPLAPAQQQALVDTLLAAWSPSVCPHGRPTLFALTVEEMERRFLRR
jgi:DNA mismatch repair protein MutL